MKFANEQFEDMSYEEILSPRGSKDSKRNGIASVKTLWERWLRLQAILEGYEELSLSLAQDL